MAFSVKDIAFAVYILFYYTQVVGLSGTLTGLALLLTTIWDAVTDPTVGSWSDNLRSKWGRRHPFMALGGIPLALSFLALFNPPMEWSQTGKFWWFLICCFGVRTFLTIFIIPHRAMPPELSKDYQERSSIISYGTVLYWVNSTLLAFSVMMFLMPGKTGADGSWIDGRFIYDNYRVYGLISCVLVAIYTTVSTVSTVKYIPLLNHVPLDRSTGAAL
jgi:Na+/melibiose symporter-like transporter